MTANRQILWRRTMLRPIIRTLLFFFLTALLPAHSLRAQIGYYFGQNKVQYKNFDWAVYRTEHFDVHYYQEEEMFAYDAARMAERAYDYLRETLDHPVKERIPIILYASLNDFNQTNVVWGTIDQGTRGVTESLKKRVVIPFTGSYRDFEHVLVHELVHAFQFDIMYHGVFKKANQNLPLWFFEGLAEYLALGMDNITMMWVRDGLLHDDLLTVEELNSAYDIRVYRLGQSLWHFIGETYGHETVASLFKTAIQMGNLEAAVKAVFGLDLEGLTKAWHEYAALVTLPKGEEFGVLDQDATRITWKNASPTHMNIVPSVSPDGRDVVYISDKDGYEDLYVLREDDTGSKKEERIAEGGRSKSFEAMRFYDSTIGWSRDGRKIAVVSKCGRDDALYIMNPYTKETMHRYVFRELNGLQSPGFDPEGKRVVFVGNTGGSSDLYLLDLESGALVRLTQDRFSELHPQWSPNGKSIIFATDRGDGTDEESLIFGDCDLAVYDFQSATIEMVVELEGNLTSPQWLPDGSGILFLSDHQNISNIYEMHFGDRSITRITEFQNGIAGVTSATPALSLSADGRVLVFSAFQNRSWDLYRIDLEHARSIDASHEGDSLPADSLRVVLPDSAHCADSIMASQPSASLPVPSGIPENRSLYREYELSPVGSVEYRKYRSELTLDAVAVGTYYDSYYGGVGQAQFLFSDMLGNHNLYLSTGLQFSSLLHSDFGLTYVNQGGRINYGLQLFQASYSYTASMDYASTSSLRNTYRGASGIMVYPIDRFSRIELSSGITWVDQDAVYEEYGGSGIDRESYDIDSFNYLQIGSAFVFDNTVHGRLGPMGGNRRRFTVETTVKDIQFTNLFADYRRYFRMNHRSVLAWRLVGGMSAGRDEQVFSIGGPYTYRGADYDELLGSRCLFSNLEYRFPLFPFLPDRYDILSAASFLDAAAAWGVDIPGYGEEKLETGDVNTAMGVGARLNLGYFLLEFDVAWPTDFTSFGKAITLFSINTFY
jgi:Tol biopolymer transport system component